MGKWWKSEEVKEGEKQTVRTFRESRANVEREFWEFAEGKV